MDIFRIPFRHVLYAKHRFVPGKTQTVHALNGSASLALGASATLTTGIPLTGSSSLTLTTGTPTLDVLMPISGNAALSLSASGSLTTAMQLTATSSLALVGQGNLTTAIPLIGPSSLSLGTSGALTTGNALVGSSFLAISATGELLSLGFPATFPATAVLDNFNRANQGPPPSASWVNCSGSGWHVIANICAPFSGATQHGSTWNNSFHAIQEVYYKIANSVPASSGYLACYTRLQTPTNLNSDHYEVRAHLISGLNNDVLRLFKVIGGVTSQIGIDIALAVDLAVGDQFGLRCEGTTLTVWFNGVLKRTVTDSSLNMAGYIGVYNAANAGTAMIDDFGGGQGVTIVGSGGSGEWNCMGRGALWPYRHSLVGA